MQNAVTRTPDEEIKACFEDARQKLDGLLKSRKQVIQDLARELEDLGRRTEDIAAEIVHELRNCEELSRSQIYSYLDDKYKNQTQAQRRKGKKESNPDPKTGTEFLSPEKGKTEQSTNTNTSASDPLQTASEFEFIIPKERYEMVGDAMDKSNICKM